MPELEPIVAEPIINKPASAPVTAWKTEYENLKAEVDKCLTAYHTYGAGTGTAAALHVLSAFCGRLQKNTAPPTFDQVTGERIG